MPFRCVVEAPPTPEAPDRNIRAVLQKAAADPAFRVRLLNNREAALKDFPLSDAERNMLLAASATQIEKMVEQARQRPVTHLSPLAKVGLGVAAAGVVIALSTHSTQGIRPEGMAHYHLETIAAAQRLYQEQYGRYGNLQELTGGERPVLRPEIVTKDARFVFEIKVDGGSFTAIARMRNSERAWQVGPDGQVKPLE